MTRPAPCEQDSNDSALPLPGGADVFAHFSAVQMDGFRTLKQGSRVSYELTQGPKGDLAQNIRPVPGADGVESVEHYAEAANRRAPQSQAYESLSR
jgi:CspA family cold shock protein